MKKIKLVVIIVFVVVVIIPFETSHLDEWRVRVVDENNTAYSGKSVVQFCENYTLGVAPCFEQGESTKVTDKHGYVTFPKRTFRLSLLSRIVRTAFNFVMIIAHGSVGNDIYLQATGPQGVATLKYDEVGVLPAKFVLPSKSKSR